MKKVLVFLLVCLSSTVMFAQNHYQVIVPDEYQGINMIINASIVIDGVTQADPNLELGVFSVTTGECRASKYPGMTTPFGTYYYNTSVKAIDGELLTYKVYNHETGQEWTDVVFTEDYPQVSFTQNDQFGNARTPWYVYVQTTSTGYTLEIDPYEGERDNYYLIASPVGAIAANAVEGLRTPDFDFYSFDQAAEDGLEWINLRDEETFELQPNVGYLYANNTGTDLTFYGTPTTEEFVTVDLTQAEAAEGLDFPDWNLVGNPFEVVAYPNQPFYSMVEGAFVSNAANAELPAMNGAFVVRTDEVTSVTFSKVPANKVQLLALNLSTNGKVLDRAIVSFGQGQQLPKFQLFKNSSKLYIPQDGNDYAVVTSEGMGEMPVSFKAESNGTYSLNLSSQNVDFAYLHLIDNLTGADQDLLANPSYSFSANTTDYDSRFRLVFATGNDDESFAFFSNGSLFVNNEGSAVLQVVDVTGRIVKSESINGCANVNFDAAPGVYMVRLVNGDNMKVQKVVK